MFRTLEIDRSLGSKTSGLITRSVVNYDGEEFNFLSLEERLSRRDPCEIRFHAFFDDSKLVLFFVNKQGFESRRKISSLEMSSHKFGLNLDTHQ